MTDHASKAKEFRKLAADARNAAQSVSLEDQRKMLLSIAVLYDRLAAGHEPDIGKSGP